MEQIGFIGTGKMASALVRAFIAREKTSARQIICYDITPTALESLHRDTGVHITTNCADVLEQARIIFLAFKPQNFPDAVMPWKNLIRSDQVFVSILAGVRLKALQNRLGPNVIRVMPNVCCLIGEMAAGFAPADGVSPADCHTVKALLDCAGKAVQVAEDQLDAVTGLSGSGPAFVAHLAQQMIAGGQQAGLPEETARELALQTLRGTASLLQEKGWAARELIEMVSSPNGTTVAGRKILENSDVGEMIQKTILRAAQRSRELGQAGGS